MHFGRSKYFFVQLQCNLFFETLKSNTSSCVVALLLLLQPGLLKEALKQRKEWESIIPGSFGQTVASIRRETTLEKALLKLKEEQAAIVGSKVIVDPNDDGQLMLTTTTAFNGDHAGTIGENGDSEFEEIYEGSSEVDITVNIQKAEESSPGIVKQGESKDPVVVFIRHGRTPHNNLGLFTGWEDPPLAPDGIEDAKNAGRLLKMHGFEFDVVYTSWLTRAIETACTWCNKS